MSGSAGVPRGRGTGAAASDPRRQVTGALCTVDLVKHDAELKILVGCTAGDCAVIRRFYRTPLSAVRILRRKKP